MDYELNNGIEPMLYLMVLLIELSVKKMVLFLWNVNRNLEVKGHDVSSILSKAQKKSYVSVRFVHPYGEEVRGRGRRRGWSDKANWVKYLKNVEYWYKV